jgi:negative regulator of flagellin synthesis FlgM
VASKINGFDTRPAPVGAGRSVAKTPDAVSGGTGNPAAGSSGSTDVHITDAASKLAALEKALRDLPAVNDTRVSEIRTAIEQGRYAIQPERIADQLMQFEQALGRLQDNGQSGN